MNKTVVTLPTMKLTGITCQTNNQSIFQNQPSNEEISNTMGSYFGQELTKKIIHGKNPGTTLCVYTHYESDFTGDYTYFIGEEVLSFENKASVFEALTIPTQCYIKFTSDPGLMSDVCINLWKKIWAMLSEELGDERSYVADFEVYDERSYDSKNAILDIYIGIKNNETTLKECSL